MHKSDFDYAGRCMRWYEWLAFLLLFALAAGVKAAVPLYRCDDARGAVTFQDRPCSVQEIEQAVAVEPAPAYAPSPTYALDTLAREPRPLRSGFNRVRNSGAQSWECRTADGQVFYRHHGCPRAIAAGDASTTAHGGMHRGKASSSNAKTVSVHAVRIPREEACAQMRRASAIGRNGHAHDEDASTYDKNLGRDLCR
ncbi:MAG: DUF4124 domain-containing protein [Gammaproteobacteria bacterium]|nr:MAG: DUF4124 domain-containing protein [Gammaproteobacteria bacterium]